MSLVLEITGLEVGYDGVRAVAGLSLAVREGEIVTLLGANGAGKTTTLLAVSGLVRPSAGTVCWQGRDITRAHPKDIVAAGIVHVPEGRRVFSTMSVHENLQLGGHLVARNTAAERIAHVYELLPRLRERRAQAAGTLSGGEQQLLAIGRAMVAGPKLLLLDEPSMGLAPLMVDLVMGIIDRLRGEGVSVLLVEQNARAALRIADSGVVIENGVATTSGSARDLLADEAVVKAYLGRARKSTRLA
uniref:ABC transporter ATP-binding protein n=1 Tax=Catellatospora vulcania TaxID=1460450 RepID=UPI001E5423F8